MSAKNKNQPLQLPHKSPSPRNHHKSGSSIQETPLNEPTKRTFGEVQNHVGQDFYQKQTERNYNRSGQMMIWLTQSEGSSKNSEGNWSIHEDSPARQQRINEICHILQQKGLMKAFQAFNELRELIANDLVQQQGQVAQRFKVIEAIERFSNRFNMSRTLFYSEQSHKKQQYKQIKGYLQEITFLRAQNAKLKNKIQNYSSRLQKNECRFDEMDNSLLNNSISFHSYTSVDSANKSDQQFQNRLDKQFVKPFVIVKQAFCDEQSTLAILTESIEVERKHSQQNYVAEIDSILIGMDNKQTQTDSYQKKQESMRTIQFGKNVLIKSVITLKSMLTLCVESVNLVIIRNPKSLQLLSQVVEKINTFRPSVVSEKQDDFLHKISQVIGFTSLMCNSLKKILHTQDCSQSLNKENLLFQ